MISYFEICNKKFVSCECLKLLNFNGRLKQRPHGSHGKSDTLDFKLLYLGAQEEP